MDKFKLIKDPVHGYILLDEELLNIVDTSAFQRLRRIHQLPFVYLVYPGARHTRFDHSLGCMHLARMFGERLGLDPHKLKVLTIAGLIHDIGHTPYSHLLEALLREKSLTHEDITLKILINDPEISESIERCSVSVRDVVDVLEKKDPIGTVVTGPVDVDKLDFLLRDSYFTGAFYGIVDIERIIYTSKLINGRLALSTRALGVVEELAIARYQSFMNIYFHHTVRAAQAMFLRGVKMLGERLDFTSMSVEEFLNHDDYTVWCMMRQNEKTREIIKNIEKRILPKVAYEYRAYEKKEKLRLIRDPEAINDVEEMIAEEAGVPRNLVWIDTPYIPPLPYIGGDRLEFYMQEDEKIVLKEYYSPLLKFTSEIYEILRVYTMREYVERVAKASEKIIGR
ncbi:MAG: HD domain-containing protein [Nitrososphaeria archaeon]|nr:HD domain-containing protein [Nitrososphaeria archaeon]MDW7986963.1 HD domain-containing protein [Nitrososphaerota archaeon]